MHTTLGIVTPTRLSEWAFVYLVLVLWGPFIVRFAWVYAIRPLHLPVGEMVAINGYANLISKVECWVLDLDRSWFSFSCRHTYIPFLCLGRKKSGVIKMQESLRSSLVSRHSQTETGISTNKWSSCTLTYLKQIDVLRLRFHARRICVQVYCI